MERISPDIFARITLDASLQRLDIVELEERMEFSPLLVSEALQQTRADDPAYCICRSPEPLPDGWDDIDVSDPATDGMGTTGTTSGGRLG